MKKIFLVNPLQSSGRSSYFPIGMMMLASFLRKSGVEVSFFDRNAIYFGRGKQNLESCDKAMLQQIDTLRPEIVGLTMMTGHYDDICHVAFCIREKYPEITIICGGTHPTFEAERTLEQIPELDIVVRGPGETPTLLLCQGSDLHEIPNIVFEKNRSGNFTINSIRRNIRYQWVSPAYDLIDTEFYWSDQIYHTNSTHIPGLAMMMTSQGCPGKCTFCVDDRFVGNGFYQNDEDIFLEMEQLEKEYGRKAFFFVDRDFRLSKKNILRFCKNKLASGRKSTPWTATIRADQVDSHLAEKLKQSNCIRIVLGLESGSQAVLDMLKKGTTVEQNYQAIRTLNDHKILVTGSFIYGLPGQTEEDLASNLTFFRSVTLFDSAVLTFLPTVGSPLYSQLVAVGELNPDDTSTWARIIDFGAPRTPERNYSDIPYERFETIYHSHANEIFDTCSSGRGALLEEYGLSQYFDYI